MQAHPTTDAIDVRPAAARIRLSPLRERGPHPGVLRGKQDDVLPPLQAALAVVLLLTLLRPRGTFCRRSGRLPDLRLHLRLLGLVFVLFLHSSPSLSLNLTQMATFPWRSRRLLTLRLRLRRHLNPFPHQHLRPYVHLVLHLAPGPHPHPYLQLHRYRHRDLRRPDPSRLQRRPHPCSRICLPDRKLNLSADLRTRDDVHALLLLRPDIMYQLPLTEAPLRARMVVSISHQSPTGVVGTPRTEV